MLASSIDMGILMDDGYTRGFKTKDVVQFIQEELGKAFTPRYCRNIMKNMSCGLKVPRPRHKKETKKMLMILRESLKKRQRVGHDKIIVTYDQARFTLDADVRRCWAFKGTTPIVYKNGSNS